MDKISTKEDELKFKNVCRNINIAWFQQMSSECAVIEQEKDLMALVPKDGNLTCLAF